jgi:hypothetical protein
MQVDVYVYNLQLCNLCNNNVCPVVYANKY